MTRFLVTGDLHLGAGNDYGREPGDRLADQDDVLEQIATLADDHNVDAILFAGDAFDGPVVQPEHYAVWSRQMAAQRVVAINGNGRHDTAMRPVKAPEVVMPELHTEPGLVQIGGVSIATLPWTSVGRLVAAEGRGDRDNINAHAAQLLVSVARGLRERCEGPAVLMLHWSIEGAALPNGLPIDEHAREPILQLDDLATLGFDAIVASHIHVPQYVGLDATSALGWMRASADGPCANGGVTGPLALYTGSPMPLTFGEAGYDHGVWFLDIDDTLGFATARFLPIESRPFLTVDVDLTTDRHEEIGIDETDAVAAAIATHLPVDDAVVRIRYKATEEQARRIDWPKLRTLLDGCHKIYSITGDIVRAGRARVDVDEEIEPIHAVGLWADSVDLDIERGEQLIDLSERYLEEVGA